ncbi:MAG: sulfite oxidase-like oxidoreductase [Proteobacteria bacterium]|nr:sulfite oxidase-like oxidoreductase [Pseudomonadota bacterium]
MNLHLQNTLPKVFRCLAAAALLLQAGYVGAADELDLAVKNGCIICHRGAEKLMGPPYAEVAKKYAGQRDAAKILAEHIVKGTGPAGQGWMKEGQATLPFMPANSAVKPKDALRLANWVLAMKGEIPGLKQYVTERLAVSGFVEHQLDLSVEELRKFPAKDVQEISVVAQSPARAGTTETFRGVLLRTLLEKASILSPGHNDLKRVIIIAKASDDYAIVFSRYELFNTAVGDGVLVYFEKDGKPLADDEGRIAMISSKDIHLGGRHVRWLNAIEVRKVGD